MECNADCADILHTASLQAQSATHILSNCGVSHSEKVSGKQQNTYAGPCLLQRAALKDNEQRTGYEQPRIASVLAHTALHHEATAARSLVHTRCVWSIHMHTHSLASGVMHSAY